MSRHRSASSYRHFIQDTRDGFYTLYWTVDFHYASSRLRHPREFRRFTDAAGAKRFAKKWGLEVPVTATQA